MPRVAGPRALGPGLPESAYEACLAYKLEQAGLRYKRQVAVPLVFENVRLDCGYRADFVVQNSVLVELKSVERLLPIHIAQGLSYVKLAGVDFGLPINFNVELLKNGIKTFVNPRNRGAAERDSMTRRTV